MWSFGHIEMHAAFHAAVVALIPLLALCCSILRQFAHFFLPSLLLTDLSLPPLLNYLRCPLSKFVAILSHQCVPCTSPRWPKSLRSWPFLTSHKCTWWTHCIISNGEKKKAIFFFFFFSYAMHVISRGWTLWCILFKNSTNFLNFYFRTQLSVFFFFFFSEYYFRVFRWNI